MVTIGYSIRASFRCTVAQQSALDRVPDDFFFGDVRKKNRPETRKIFTGCLDTLLQSIGRGQISREGALDVRESRERRDKIFAEKTENATKILEHKTETAVFSGKFPFFWPREH